MMVDVGLRTGRWGDIRQGFPSHMCSPFALFHKFITTIFCVKKFCLSIGQTNTHHIKGGVIL